MKEYKFKKGDTIEVPMFGDKLYFGLVQDPFARACVILPQNKIPIEIEGNLFLYSDDNANESSSKYKDLYPENVL